MAPFSAPASVPTSRPASIETSMPSPCSRQTARLAAHRPTIEPTEMSISPQTITSVIGSATIAVGITPATAIERFDAVRKYS